jgi:predicted AAA+ superfamily ATPase
MIDDGFVTRSAGATLARLQRGFPVIGITGPRQAGKTTLARISFPDKPYVTLEDPDQLDFAQTDPRRFLERFPDGAILDEVQRCPDLFSYLQGIVDRHQVMGEFVLTGSQQFGFRERIAQSLAGRIAVLHLLPFSSEELRRYGDPARTLDSEMFRGFYPPVHDRLVSPADWYASYVQTYVERDVQQVLRVKDTNDFRLLLRLCAGRAGQLLNLSSIGNDAGVSHNTIREWLSVLEASYITFRLPPHHRNFSKRLIKSPKLYFFDIGLLCWLLGIRSDEQLATHALRGAVFENYVIAELAKQYYSNGELPPFYFWRDQSGLEIDLIIERAGKLQPVEIKSGQTLTSDFFKGLNRWKTLAGKEACDPALVYGGNEKQERTGVRVLGWQHLGTLPDGQ